MDIREYQQSDLPSLFEYWRDVGAEIPYFFPVSSQKWQACLLKDELDGKETFKNLQTYLAVENGQIQGFVQCGQPNHAWDETGEKHCNPHIGVIRHLHFDRERNDVGETLLAKASDNLMCFDRTHAFYHALGMSCNAYHGKLHSSQSHVDQLLRASGFQIEHENAYYVLDMECAAPVENARLHFCSVHGTGEKRFEIRLNAEVVGTAGVRYLDTLTDGYTRDTVYLGWLGVAEQHRGQQIGTEFLKLLVQFLLGKQYRYLHTDTAGSNTPAQHLCEKLGFRKEGCTRSYVQA